MTPKNMINYNTNCRILRSPKSPTVFSYSLFLPCEDGADVVELVEGFHWGEIVDV